MLKLKVFEKLYFEKIFRDKLKKLKYKKCCNCKKNFKEVKLISNCHICKKNYCFNCCNELFFDNYFNEPEKELTYFITILFHTIDRQYFNDICCKTYYLNFISNSLSGITYYEKYNTIYNTLKLTNYRNNNININNLEIDKIYDLKLKILYKYTNNIFWTTYLLIKLNIPLDIIFLIMKYNINYIKFKY